MSSLESVCYANRIAETAEYDFGLGGVADYSNFKLDCEFGQKVQCLSALPSSFSFDYLRCYFLPFFLEKLLSTFWDKAIIIESASSACCPFGSSFK